MKLKLINATAIYFMMLGAAIGGERFFDAVDYKGAFGATNWASGWTALSHYGIMAQDATPTNTVTVNDADISGGTTVHWTADNTYLLNGRVFVDDGCTLHIEAGTVIKGKAGSGENASALVVARGGKIYAEGTADRPIIFTAEIDDVNNPADVSYTTNGLWGGVIILGKASINRPAGEHNIEGIPTTESRGLYGGSDDEDNSGIFRYVSIRHGGAEIGSDNEINGLTMGGVGRGTTIEYVEIYANQDDGFEWFGGTVNSKHLIAAFCGDDAFDMDEGFRGKNQFVFAIQHETFGNMCAEHDGAPKSDLQEEPKSYAVTYNATYLGSGKSSTNLKQDQIFRLRENWGGEYNNSIFGDYNGYGVRIENTYPGSDAKDRLAAGELKLLNNIWFNVNGFSLADSIGKESWTQAYLQNTANGNTEEGPQLKGISRAQDNGLDPRPATDGPAFSGNLAEYPNDDFFDAVDYKGAFGATNWASGWTALSHYGIMAQDATPTNTVTVNDADISGGTTVHWTADNTYLLNGRVFVDDGCTLHIEAGTVIKGKAGSGENASALVVARGGKIYAEGTADRPIIFTAEIDDVNNPADVSYTTNGLWGGVIILGKASINRPAGEHNIEGIPTTESRGLYGGSDDEDNSGIFRYVSIRHGGAEIGSDNEINGLTMGGVGRGTTIEYVEIYANQDDGFEWFGGTVNSKHLIAAFCGDDAFDMDEGFRGKNQFVFAIQHETFGNMCAEHDGAPKSDLQEEPKSYAVTYNATYLGSGKSSTNLKQDQIFRLRENWGGEYNNSIFGDYNGYGVRIENTYPGSDAKDRLAAGELKLLNNIWFNVNGFSLADSIGKESWTQAYLQNTANGNTEEEPQLKGISRAQNNGLDPRPATDGPAFSGNLADYPITSIEEVSFNSAIPQTFALEQNFPNPFNPVTNIKFDIKKAGKVELIIFNILGQKVATLMNEFRLAGTHQIQWNAKNLPSGTYIYVLKTANTSHSRKMLLMK
jgi:hypothetical protein